MSDLNHCPQCGDELEIGSWPMCKGPGSHGSIYRRNALAFDPILAWELPDGQKISTGSNDINVIPPGGGKPIWVTDLHHADRLMKDIRRHEQEEIDIRAEHKRNHYDKVQRESRTQLRAELERRGISARNMDAIIADREGRGPDKNEVMRQFEASCAATGKEFNREHFERVYDQTQRTRRNPDYRGRPESTFEIEVLTRDSSNRQGYRSEQTGWKYRKS